MDKKRMYLKLSRSKKELKAIKKRNIMRGCWENSQAWRRIREAPLNTKRVWYYKDNKPFVVIKTKKGFVHYTRWLWKKEKGPIPKGMKVRISGNDKINFTIKDLFLISNSDHARLNSKQRIPTELRETLKLINKLNRIITQKQAS